MKPSILQRTFAHSGLLVQVWLHGSALLVAAIGIANFPFSQLEVAFVRNCALFLCLVASYWTLGYFLAVFIGWMMISPTLVSRGEVNGAPFHEGDRVQILIGPHRGRVCRVYKLWQGSAVRVEIPEANALKYEDVFEATEIMRVEDA